MKRKWWSCRMVQDAKSWRDRDRDGGIEVLD